MNRKAINLLLKNAKNEEERARIRDAFNVSRSASKREEVHGTASVEEKHQLQFDPDTSYFLEIDRHS